MSGFSNSPKILKGGIVLIDPVSSAVRRIISLQYNPDLLSRSFQIQGFSEGGDRAESLRLKGPAVESFKLDAEIDAADQLEFANQKENRDFVSFGIQPQLAVLESLVNPTSEQLLSNNDQAQSGVLEIVPMEAPLALFVWSKNRIVPVRVTEFSITEEAFDSSLNPIRAKVSLGLRVLSVDDLGFSHKGGSLFMSYLRNKEALARKARGGTLSTLGLEGLP